MATRKVFGTIHDSHDAPWANQRVTFVLRVGSFTSSAQYPRKRVETKTNAAGYFEVDLWANSDGLLPTTYQCKLPDADEFEFRLSNGATAVNLSELRGLGGISTQAPQTLLQQLEPYFLSQSEGDGRYRKLTDTISFGDLAGGVSDGQIPGTIARIDDVIARIAQHANASDPHPQYLTPAEGAVLFAPAEVPSATNLSITTRTATTLTIASDTGEDALFPAATQTAAGLLTGADKARIDTALQPGEAATPAQGAKADTALQPASNLDAAKLTGTVPIESIPAAIATDTEVAAAISAITPASIGADIAGPKTLTPTPTDPGNAASNSAFLSWLIAAMRGAQATLGGLGALANKSTIADADVATGAAIGWAKISKTGATPGDIGAQPASAKLSIIAGLSGNNLLRADGTTSAITAAEVPTLDAAKINTGTFTDSQIPASIARDAEVAAAIAGVTASSIGAIPASEKGATNGVASLVSGKVPAAQSRGSNVTFNAATGIFDFAWADGSTQSVDTVIEQLLQASNYNPATKTVTFTRANGTTFDVPLADLVDVAEIVTATQNPIGNPTTGQKLYVRSDTGEYWINSGGAWSGPFLNITAAERSKLAGIAAGAQVNAVNSVAGKTGAVLLNKGDVGLANVDNTADSAKPVSTATQAAINAITPGSIGADIAGPKTLTPTPTDPGNAASNSAFLSWLIAAMREAQSTLSGLGALATKSTIVSADITDGTIVNADISPTAAISASKLAGVQPLNPTTTAIGSLTNGIPEITGVGAVSAIVPSTSGRAVITGDPAGARAAICAQPIYPGALRSAALPATASETDLAIDANEIAYEWGFGAWRAKDDTKLNPLQRINAARGLVYNGGCTLPLLANPGTPTIKRVPGCSGIYRKSQGGAGWRDISADITEKLYGGYSLSISGRNIVGYDDPFPVVAGVIYGCWGGIKQSTAGENTWYQMLLALDDDGNTITPPTCQYVASSRSRLAVALVSGATQIQIQRFRDAPGTSDPVTSWNPAIGYPNLGTFGIFNWAAVNGFVYPTWENETAQRPAYTRRLFDWINPVVVSGNNYVITLNVAYSGPTIPAGTPVANMVDGSTFVYPNSGSYNTDTSWLNIRPNVTANAGQSGLFAVRGSYGNNAAVTPLPPWTTQIIPGMLVSYGANLNTTTNWHYDIYLLPL